MKTRVQWRGEAQGGKKYQISRDRGLSAISPSVRMTDQIKTIYFAGTV